MKKLLFFFCLVTLLSGCSQSQKTSDENKTTRIMSYNIRNGIGLDEKVDLERTAGVINSVAPDIVALQEIDSVTGRSKGVDILVQLGDLTKMHPVYGAAIEYDGGKYGIGILSKQEPLSWKNIPLPGREEARTLLLVEYAEYVFCCTHWSLAQEDREASVHIINEAVKDYHKPVFLAGDLNTESDSTEYKALTIGWKALNDPKQATFPADKPVEKIDHILGYTLAGQEYDVREFCVVDEPVASDHRPIFVDITVIQADK